MPWRDEGGHCRLKRTTKKQICCPKGLLVKYARLTMEAYTVNCHLHDECIRLKVTPTSTTS